MTRAAIGGTLTFQAYELLAVRHKPKDPSQLAAEIHRLHAEGLTASDISTALRLHYDMVVNVLATPLRSIPANSLEQS